MLKKIFQFVFGYVIIKIVGKNKERFIDMCLYNGLNVWEVIPSDGGLSCRTDRRSFAAMRRLVRKSGVRLSIAEKRGLRRVLHRYRRRWGFALSGLLVCIFFLMLPQYILCIEIDGVYGADRGRIEAVLREHGVYIGAKKSGMDDLSEIKNAIIFEVPGINWAWLYDEGARMRLRVQESVPAPAVRDKRTPTDIVAACDGWVTRADVFSGERRVGVGTAVSAGETLVSGKVAVYPEGEPERYMYVHSDAVIMADTIRAETGEFRDAETLRIKTGRGKRNIALHILGRELRLFRDPTGGYADHDIKETVYDLDMPIGYSGLSLAVYAIDEVKETERRLTRDEVLDRARETLEERICKRLGAGAIKQREELSYTEHDGVYTVELKMYLKENIGVEIPMSEQPEPEG